MWRICSGLVILLSAPMVYADDRPTDRVVIDVVTLRGTGCLAGTVAISVAPDNTEFSISYSTYLAQVGVGARPSDARKTCSVSLAIHVPQGFAYSIASAGYRGFASLAPGASALFRANYFFQGESPPPFGERRLAGPYFDDWEYPGDTTDISTPPSCSSGLRTLNINTELQVNAGTSDPTTTTSFVTIDSADGAITNWYRFLWKRCP